jgi:hypothetical protein
MHSRALVMTDLVSDLLNIAPRDKAEILARALPYIRRFLQNTIDLPVSACARSSLTGS